MNFSLAILFAILSLAQIGMTQPLYGDQTLCIDELNLELEKLEPNEGVEKLINNVRSLNPALVGENLNRLLENKGAQLDLYKAGFIKDGEDGPLVDACADYVSNVMKVMRATSCGQKLIELSENNKTKFDETLNEYSGLDKVYGYARACLRLLWCQKQLVFSVALLLSENYSNAWPM